MRSDAGFLILAATLLTLGPGARAAEPAGIRPDTFNYVIGTQTFGPAYQFSREPKLVETARAILAMGSNTLKFSLARQDEGTPKPRTLAELAGRDPVVRSVLEMPFAHYLMWVSPLGAPQGATFAPERLDAEYREIHDLTKYLLTTFNGSGKSFYLGNWEGDWLLTHTNPDYTPTDAEVTNMINWAKTRQRAVDDARRATPHAGVHVHYYVEVNRVFDAMGGKVRVSNKVLPHTNPDFVSYSSYDAKHGDIEANLVAAMDYIEKQLAPKPGIPGKRVFIGEYGMPALGNSPEAQDRLARQVMRAGLRWGCPFVLYWEMYNNEVTKDGKQRGFWLIDDQGVKQPVYHTHRNFYQQAGQWVAAFRNRNGREPTRDEFGRAALEWLPLEPVPR